MSTKITNARLGIIVGQRNFRELRNLLIQMNQVDVASFINDLPPDEAYIIFRTLPKNMAADVFPELDSEIQINIVETISDKEIYNLMDILAVDDAVDMLEEMPADLVKRTLKSASSKTRTLLNKYLKYPDNSVGSIMTAEYTDLEQNMTIAQAISHIRAVGEDKETIYICYVIDKSDLLLGVVTVRDLLTASDDDLVKDIMQSNVKSVSTTVDKEEASRILSKYSLISIPVIDNTNKLVGIVTIDDAVDVLQEETTEDLELMAGISPSDKPYLKTGIISLAKNRFIWLFVLMIGGIISETILNRHEGAISAIPLLVAFIPMLSDMGGDAGSQVSTLIIRGMALGEIKQQHFFLVVIKEILVSIMVTIPLVIVNYLRIVAKNPDQYMVALVISLTLICTIAMSNIFGVILPMVAKKINIDPALMATPMIATIVDICSILIYFSIATALLNI